MFFADDSSSGVSGDLDSATTVASYMEGYWGMGKTVSSASASRRLEGSTPGGGRSNTSPVGDRGSMPGVQRLADRIEDNLSTLLVKAEQILRENERYVLALAHALESHKTLSGEDVTAVFDGGHGPVVNGVPYADDGFIARLREYHLAAAQAHREHNQVHLPMPEHTPVPAYAIADGYDALGPGGLYDGTNGVNGVNGANGSGANGNGANGTATGPVDGS